MPKRLEFLTFSGGNPLSEWMWIKSFYNKILKKKTDNMNIFPRPR